MSGQSERQERTYLCPNDQSILLISDLPSGVIRGVWCGRCQKRHTITLGRPSQQQLVARNADGSPRPANAPPPIETRKIREGRRG
jgi:hypothetical protein